MWRSFFFAVGIFWVILGLQCLVVDRFFVSQNSKVAEIVVKALNVIDPPNTNSLANNGQVLPQAQFQKNNVGFSSSAGSQFGPSRFNSPFSNYPSNVQGYGGSRPFQNVGFQQQVSQPNLQAKKPPRPFATKDWMPWSLIAAGILVVIYTKATSRSNHDE